MTLRKININITVVDYCTSMLVVIVKIEKEDKEGAVAASEITLFANYIADEKQHVK